MALLLLTLLCTAGGGLAAVIYIDVVQVEIVTCDKMMVLILILYRLTCYTIDFFRF